MLMGGGGSFSAGGPGKGMHSWLCKSILVFISLSVFTFVELVHYKFSSDQ